MLLLKKTFRGLAPILTFVIIFVFVNIVMVFVMENKCKASELVRIPSGSVEAIWLSPMSLKDKKKSNKVIIKVNSFQMMAKAVSVLEFQQFLREFPEWQKEKANQLFTDKRYLKDMESGKPLSPITNVSWFAARAYCQSKNLRLPTVNEWEYAAAASERKKDANKDEKFLKRILEWYGEPQGGSLKEVGSIYKNLYGLYDMHGLIWEWTEDFNSTFVTGESREDSSFNKDMFCGAGALSSSDKENYAAYMRFAFRSSLKGNMSIWNLGFRCVQ